jgi:toxin-antitoxin system PIN domain toxin
VLAVDTNVLVYAATADSPQHAVARRLLDELAEGSRSWALPWPCVYEFLRVVTHPAVRQPPATLESALENLRALFESASLMLLSATAAHAQVLQRVLIEAHATGNLVHDAHIAALCFEHGVSELITGDRDFARFRRLKITNPFA